jgi:hypothetical protein
LHSFKNIDGEGVTATVSPVDSEMVMDIAIGNEKLTLPEDALELESLRRRVEELEKAGNTVVIMSVN